MKDALIRNMAARIDAYDEWIQSVSVEELQHRLAVEKHKTIAEHLWCVIGARESYSRAFEVGSWQGFSCSLSEVSLTEIQSKLRQSGANTLREIENVDVWTTEREELLVKLAEHEVLHEGQLIRHVYGTSKSLPESWAWA